MTKPRPLPEDYVAVRLNMGAKDAAKHYKADKTTIRRWDNSVPLADRDRIAEAGRERQRRAGRRNFAKSPLRRAAKDARKIHTLVTAAPPPVAGEVPDAAIMFLRRFYTPVYHAGSIYGKALSGVYVAGRLRLNAAELLQLAAKHGYDADEWRRLAA